MVKIKACTVYLSHVFKMQEARRAVAERKESGVDLAKVMRFFAGGRRGLRPGARGEAGRVDPAVRGTGKQVDAA